MIQKLWPISVFVLITLVACGGDPILLPNLNEAERSQESVTLPTEYPVLCEIPDWDTSCWQAFAAFEEIAVNNADLATINAQIAEDSDKAYDHILSAAKQQQEISKIREEQLQIVRRDAFWDVWLRNGIIAIGILLSL